MKTRRTLLAVLLLGATFGGWSRHSAAGGDATIAVIVNKASALNSVDVSDLRPVFQTTKKSLGAGGEVTPLNLPSESKLRQDFDQAVLGLDPDRAARYWKDRKIRGGARAPKQLPNTAAVLSAVSADPAAIGYVSLSEVTRSVKVVAKISGGKLVPP
jgi:ABC-type phosphate transport system substrate-binding protein